MRRRINISILLFMSVLLILLLKRNIGSDKQCVTSEQPNNLTIILSNRVPKCGSHLTRMIINRLSIDSHSYGSENSENHYDCQLSVEKQDELRGELIQKAQNAHYHRFVYDRHFHFIDFAPAPGIVFYYVNQLRDPIDQLVSGYYYNRYICMITSPSKKCEYYSPQIYNLTLDECVSVGDPTRCLSKAYGAPEYLVYFCGQSPVCRTSEAGRTSPAALSLAKTNIERHYLFIGLLEYVKNSFEVLEHLKPSMFKGLVHLYKQMKNDSRITSTPEQFRHRPSNHTRQILRKLLAAEYELYDFVKQRFIYQYSQIYHRLPMSSD